MQNQRLLIEFNGLKTASPAGVFLSLSPSDPALWTGVIFVRDGPYAPAILRFQISFPAAYPAIPPLITFPTDVFHPLLAPLTVQLYTSSEDDSNGVVVLDDEKLPPGGFSLRHGFPSWFKRTRTKPVSGEERHPTETPENKSASSQVTPIALSSSSSTSRDMADPEDGITVYELLRYIRSTFDDASMLDEVPIEAAGNSGAWRAWKAHRAHEAQVAQVKRLLGISGNTSSPSKRNLVPKPVRQPGEWNWEGVWEVRAKKGIDLSVSEASLYGNSTSNDELINFLEADEEVVETMKENMVRSLRAA
ncbi:hypothetical protein VC83_02076 [Pseudogymnoascus destructans]|uniref:UBC core domain-containing protein n=2 Tax=Pseudogymnoascus destructans TaxID=655981 RepID=L8FTG1_PSED2|nr:uncharacterized protein VC83_02076 [Pseudogymnoascus destructans]ELR04152.1 hypothetical protein GMDG_01456 [Pseudogymnoascus destructans 20631-21]OAF61614.1 hypothetical protein VC83_02076 [Pseudogymnoascus destructans]